MFTIRPACRLEHAVLLDIWLRSVRATHTFLSEQDIQSLLPVVRDQALANLELWVLATNEDRAAGFMGLADRSLEALFIDPNYARRGGGRLMLEFARRLKGSLTVDVNEQNPAALQFYRANGFAVTGRSPLDAAGRPFPLLHLREIGEARVSGSLEASC